MEQQRENDELTIEKQALDKEYAAYKTRVHSVLKQQKEQRTDPAQLEQVNNIHRYYEARHFLIEAQKGSLGFYPISLKVENFLVKFHVKKKNDFLRTRFDLWKNSQTF